VNAIEFQTVVRDAVIHIPEPSAFENKHVRVIILDESRSNIDHQAKKNVSSIDALFDKYHLNVGRFDRDLANER